MSRIAATWLFSIALAGAGLWYDIRTGFQLNAFQRSGAIIACLSVFLPLIRIQFARAQSALDDSTDALLKHYGIETFEDTKARSFLKSQARSAIALVIVSTLIASFGDLTKGIFVSAPTESVAATTSPQSQAR